MEEQRTSVGGWWYVHSKQQRKAERAPLCWGGKGGEGREGRVGRVGREGKGRKGDGGVWQWAQWMNMPVMA